MLAYFRCPAVVGNLILPAFLAFPVVEYRFYELPPLQVLRTPQVYPIRVFPKCPVFSCCCSREIIPPILRSTNENVTYIPLPVVRRTEKIHRRSFKNSPRTGTKEPAFLSLQTHNGRFSGHHAVRGTPHKGGKQVFFAVRKKAHATSVWNQQIPS